MTITFFNKIQLKKIAIGAGIAMLGAGLTYLSEIAAQIDFGDWTPIVTAVFAIGVNTLRKLATNF